MNATPSSAVTVSKLGYVGFETPDVDRLVDYYTRVLDFVLVERSGDEAYLTTNFEHHEVVIRKSSTSAARSFVGYRLREDLSDAERRLKEAGFRVERRSDIAPSTPNVLVLEEPGSGVPLHFFDGQATSGVTGYTSDRPTKLGHVAAFTRDLGGIQAFYEQALGFRWSDTIDDFFVFMRCNADHHAANFIKSDKFTSMHHLAYELRDLYHMQTLLDRMASHGVRLTWGPGRHGPGHNVFTYHKDPDGNTVELFTQIDVIHDEAQGYFEPRPWHEDYPQYPKVWALSPAISNSWGPLDQSIIDH